MAAYEFNISTPEAMPPSVHAKSSVTPGLVYRVRYTVVAELGNAKTGLDLHFSKFVDRTNF